MTREIPTDRRPTFSNTHWSMIHSLNRDNGITSAEFLFRAYRNPIYLYLRKWKLSHEDAEDLTQDFFIEMLERKRFLHADPAKGRFRNFLLACLKNYLNLHRRRKGRLKRGGGEVILSFNDEHHDQIDKDACLAYDLEWARTLLSRSFEQLKSEYLALGKPFDELRCFIEEPRGTVPLEETAQRLNISVPALRSAIFRFRRRYAEIVRIEVAQTTPPGEDMEDELKYLLSLID